jgi:hypothetical protein
VTFQQVANEYISLNRTAWGRLSIQSWTSAFNETKRHKRHFTPITAAINDLPIGAIDTPLVVTCLKPAWERTPQGARVARMQIEKVLGYAAGERLAPRRPKSGALA